MTFEASLAAFERAAGSDYETIIAAFRALLEVPKTADRALLVRFFALMNGLLTFEPARSRLMTWNFSTTDHIRACASERIEKTLYERYEVDSSALPQLPFSAEELREQLAPWLAVMMAHDWRFDDALYRVLRSGQAVTKQLFRRLAAELEAAGKRSASFTEGVAEAIDLEQRRFESKPWAEVSVTLLPLFDHPHVMVRAAAAKQLGNYLAIAVIDDEPCYADIPPLAQMLTFIGEKEIANNNIASGFISGLCAHGLFSLTDESDGFREALQQQGFDVRQWALSLTIQRDSTAPDAPNCQPWWFPVHEFFSFDPDAVRQIYEAGHTRIAMMTALEDAPEEMLPMIQRLARDPDPEISNPAREHLARRS